MLASTSLRSLIAASAAVALIACDDSGDSPPPDPAAAPFAYACTTREDAFCDDAAHPPLPGAVATSATFEIHYAPATAPTSAVTLSVPDDVFVTVDADQLLHANRAGFTSLLATNEAGEVLGYTEVIVHDVSTIEIDGLPDPLILRAGESYVAHATPHDTSGATLAGSLAYGWESMDDSVVKIAAPTEDDRSATTTLVAVAPGTTVVRVYSKTAYRAIAVTVGGAS